MSPPTLETTPTTAALEMIQVTVGSLHQTERVVLEDVNWTVAPGDYWVVGGLHASGKSDLLAVAAGIMPPLAGIHRVLGRELAVGFEAEVLAARLPIGLVFDGGRLLNHLTIAENVSLPIRYHQNLTPGECQERVQEWLKLIELERHADDRPAQLGRNWRQRVGLARALILQPQILLLDNPLTGLDPRDVSWWLRLLQELSTGHRMLGGHPVTLAATADDLRPWREQATRFALLKERQFIVLGDRPGLAAQREPFLENLLPGVAARS